MTIHRQLSVTERQPLLAYLFDTLQLKRVAVKKLLKFGAVSVNGATVRQFDHPLVPGDEVCVGNLHAAAAAGRLAHAHIHPVYEDEALIVVDKPPGLLTVATDRENADTLYVHVNEYLRGRDAAGPAHASVVHRLDQETSGLVLFAKSESVRRLLQEAWPTVEKTYFAVVEGQPPDDEGTVKSYLIEESKSLKVYISERLVEGARLAITQYRVLKTLGDFSLLEVRLETGRKHQIRVHLASLDCPVAGDRRYGRGPDACYRLALHASGLLLMHPVSGDRLEIKSPLPRALRRLVS